MILSIKYDIGDKVIIRDAGIPGTIVKIELDGKNLVYDVEYWNNGEIKNVWQNEDQLDSVNKNKKPR